MHVQREIRGLLARAIVSCVLVGFCAGASYAQWTQTNGPKGGSIRSLVTVANEAGGTSLYAGQIRVWRTDDHGTSWTHLPNGLTDPNAFALLAVPNGSGGNDILETGRDLDLAQESLGPDLARQVRIQDLERDLSMMLVVFGQVDGGRPTLTELALDPVGSRQRLLETFERDGQCWVAW